LHAIVIALLLTGAVVIVALCVLGLFTVSDSFDRLHFLSPVTSIGAVLVAAAIVVEEALSTSGVKAILTVGLLLLTSPILSHATARAARVRQYGHWKALPGEEVSEE
jgi:multicomponent Na+:H+ antiporter subunit G